MDKNTFFFACSVAILIASMMWHFSNKEGYGTSPLMTLSRIVSYPTVNRDYVKYSQAGDSSNYASEDDPYQSQTILNLGPYPAPPRSNTDTNMKDYIQANYLSQMIPPGGLYGPADPDDMNYAYAAYTDDSN